VTNLEAVTITLGCSSIALLAIFRPAVTPGINAFPQGAFNLREYTEHDTDSIFIGTTRPYINATNTLTAWHQRVPACTQRHFLYNIFAYGGIDVNHVLGHHNHENQHEVAFPGGIRPEMVRLAWEYNGTRIIRYWVNTNFHCMVNPPGHIPPPPPPMTQPQRRGRN